MGTFSEQEQQQIREAVEAAERFTSGEIRVCIEKTCSEDVLDRAADYFKKLEMHRTVLRNGVLIYVATQAHKFAIIGDAGINRVVPANFWDQTKDMMRSHFREGRLTEGIIAGVRMAGEQLQNYFPYQEDNKNELPDDISFMDGH